MVHSLLASALAGRSVDLAAAAAGELAWTDGATVYIDPALPPAEKVRALAVQTSLIAAGSLDPSMLRELARRPALARRYLSVEGHRALAANEHVLPPQACNLLDRDRASRTDSAAASLALARSAAVLADPPPVFGVIRPRRTRRVSERPAERASRPLPELVDEDADDLGPAATSPVGGGGPIGRLLQRMLRPVRDRRGEGPPGADTPTHIASSPGPARPAGAASTGAPGALDQDAAFTARGARYPEWDVHRGRYRPDWCTVSECDAPAASGDADLPADRALRRALARLGVGLVPVRRRAQGEDIDIDAAVEAYVNARAGAAPAADTSIEALRRRRDLSVFVLLDVSGSAGEPGVGGHTVHEHQVRAAAALTTVLHDLGDRVALYAFNSRGRRAVQLARIKDFDDPFDGNARRRLGALKPAAFTRLGAAIRHSTAILEQRAGTPRRLLVVLSDGFAYDHGYEGRYGEADARRSLTEARRRGVGCLCVSVGAESDTEALRRVFGAAAHANIPRMEQVPTLIGPLFRTALLSAEAQRRAFRRTERARELLAVERMAG
jgi:hypothetical protein